MTAGCLGDEGTVAHCASQSEGSGSQHLRRVAPITGDKEVALGIMVSSEAVEQDQYRAVVVRNRDGGLVGSIPLAPNRDMSRLSADEHSVFGSTDGELYAQTLGPPPVHGEYSVSLVGPDDEQLATESVSFNCYSDDGSLP